MPSSTSNSEPAPRRATLHRSAVLAAVAVLAFFVTWEIYWRGQGYVPTLNDSKNLFAKQWDLLDQLGKEDVVLAGASRIRFDIDLDAWQATTGRRPVLLGVNGAAAWPILEGLAEDTAFNGTVVCNIASSFFWDLNGANAAKGAAWVGYAEGWSLAQRASHQIALFLEGRLAFLQQDDLSFHALASRLEPPPDREGAVGRAPFPPMLALIDPDARERMLPKLASDPAYQKRVQDVWLAALDHATVVNDHEKAQLFERIQCAVSTLQSRGGKIIFLCLPSTATYREYEERLWPRAQWFDALVKELDVTGIHFEDHPALQGFSCPEWSHLTQEDATRFTKALLEHTELGKLAKQP
ncbi:MAG: hypothetical protein HYV27_23445 [Candidatus Hydrogenedentes bacterium]|nr:hypothetical protein [Candidatus Hydrogenedentota bacterium]